MIRYAFDMTNARTVKFDRIRDAVNYAAGKLYLGERDQADAVRALSAGHGYVYSYGFYSASILPVEEK